MKKTGLAVVTLTACILNFTVLIYAQSGPLETTTQTNTDSSGYVTNVNLLPLFTLTNSVGGTITREPDYQGKTLTDWLEEYRASIKPILGVSELGSQQIPSGIALRHIGTNALPSLLKMLSAKKSSFGNANYYHHLALYGFEALGPIAKPATPALIDLLNNGDEDTQNYAAKSLGAIGPEAQAAIPALLKHFNEKDGILRLYSAQALARIHSKPELVVPELIKHLDPAHEPVEIFINSIDALGAYGAQAKSAVPTLLILLNNQKGYVQGFAGQALLRIDPEAAAKAGIK